MNTLVSNCHLRLGLSLAGALMALAALLLPAPPAATAAEWRDSRIDPSAAQTKDFKGELSYFSQLGGL